MSEFCVVYDMGSFDEIQEQGTRATCEHFIKTVQSAYDKELKIVSPGEVRRIYFNESKVITGYKIN